MITIKHLRYKSILEIEDLEIEERKVTCIIGESGSGKTTLLKMLNHLLSPDKGSILYRGDDLQDLDPVDLRRKVIMLPQTPVIFHGSVKDNLIKGLEMAEGELPDHSTLKNIMSSVNLQKALDDDAENLSGGEKQRVALARVLLMNPEVLLLDEPSSALDDETEDFIIRHVVEYVKKNHKTLIMITHGKDLAKKFGDRIIEIKGGKAYEWNH